MLDAQGAFADDERTAAIEGRAVVAEGEDAVADLAEVEEALVVEPADARAGAELHAGGRAGAEGAGFDEDLVVVVQRDRARAQRGAEAVHLHDQRAGLAGAGHGVGRAEMEGGDLLQTVGRQDAVDAVIVDRGDRAARPCEEVRRAAVIIIPDLGEGEGVVAVGHAAARERDRTRALGARGEELDTAAVDDPRAGELRLIGADVEEGRPRLRHLRGIDRPVELSVDTFRKDEGLARTVAGGAEIQIGVDRRVAVRTAGIREHQTSAADGDSVERIIRATINRGVDLAGDAQGMYVEVRGQGHGSRSLEAEDARTVVEGREGSRVDGSRRADDVIRRVGRSQRLEAQRSVIPQELAADTSEDPRSDHAVRHERGPVRGEEAHGRGAAGDAEAGVRICAVDHARHHEGA